MNKTLSFCVKNQDGLVSLIRFLTIKPDGSCYINYNSKKSLYHFSLHPPSIKYVNGQMHIKTKRKIIFKRTIPKFSDFNFHRCFESVLILEPELRHSPRKILDCVKILELPKNHMVHFMLIRSDKAWGHIEEAFISDKPTSQPNESIISYPVFCGIEDLPNANYYLTYNIEPIDKTVIDYVSSIKMQNIKSGLIKRNVNHILHIRHPFLFTDIEICITGEDFAKYEVNTKTLNDVNTVFDLPINH
ncbi:hypothetical protein [Candidatus Soleaferrea massiliensis]|uniref:hypothetical protein n=1 Tax=Candidatus Soleaferrea massiliensis TaxID=1470354 RepID=UPI00058EA199|nr:hypothetical protein [Candidatus Soleaferrea massiliensis]